MDRLTIGETLEGFGFYGTPIYDRPLLLKLERHGTVVCEVREMIDHTAKDKRNCSIRI